MTRLVVPSTCNRQQPLETVARHAPTPCRAVAFVTPRESGSKAVAPLLPYEAYLAYVLMIE